MREKTEKRSGLRSGAAYAFAHFATEVLCFAFLGSRIASSFDFWGLALLYDALAFLPQTFFGLISDKFPKIRMDAIGILLMICGWFLPFDMPALVLVAVGNAFLHVEGAESTLRGFEGRLGPVGIFVGGGSFGVVTGQLLGNGTFAPALGDFLGGYGYMLVFKFIPPALLLMSLLVIILAKTSKQTGAKGEDFKCAANINTELLTFLVFVSVAARSYMAYAIPTSWNKNVFTTVLLFVFMGLGKMLGGIFADLIGCKKSAILSLVLALPFLCFGDSNMVISVMGVMFFSMTMANSVGILCSAFPENPGFAFGITTLGLFVGVLPSFFIRPDSLLAHIIVCVIVTVLAIISFALSASDDNIILRKKEKT